MNHPYTDDPNENEIVQPGMMDIAFDFEGYWKDRRGPGKTTTTTSGTTTMTAGGAPKSSTTATSAGGTTSMKNLLQMDPIERALWTRASIYSELGLDNPPKGAKTNSSSYSSRNSSTMEESDEDDSMIMDPWDFENNDSIRKDDENDKQTWNKGRKKGCILSPEAKRSQRQRRRELALYYARRALMVKGLLAACMFVIMTGLVMVHQDSTMVDETLPTNDTRSHHHSSSSSHSHSHTSSFDSPPEELPTESHHTSKAFDTYLRGENNNDNNKSSDKTKDRHGEHAKTAGQKANKDDDTVEKSIAEQDSAQDSHDDEDDAFDDVDETKPLPKGWNQRVDPKTNRYYYVDPHGTSTWTRPKSKTTSHAAKDTTQAHDTKATTTDNIDDKPLPKGWNQKVDPTTNRVYYVDPTGTSTWKRPQTTTSSDVQGGDQQTTKEKQSSSLSSSPSNEKRAGSNRSNSETEVRVSVVMTKVARAPIATIRTLLQSPAPSVAAAVMTRVASPRVASPRVASPKVTTPKALMTKATALVAPKVKTPVVVTRRVKAPVVRAPAPVMTSPKVATTATAPATPKAMTP